MKSLLVLVILAIPSSLVAQGSSKENETPHEMIRVVEPKAPPTENLHDIEVVIKRDTPMIKPIKNDPASYKDDCARGLLKECDGAEILKPWPMLAADNKKLKGFAPILAPKLKTFPRLIGVAEKSEADKAVPSKKRRAKK